jgi:sugar/nucleoside kinase (ribokinase family)
MVASSEARAAGPRLLCVGMPVRDLVFHVREVPPRSGKVPAQRYEELAGGNALNAAIAIARLGGRPALCGPSGGDLDGAGVSIVARLRDEGVDTRRLVPMPGVVTPLSTVMIDSGGERTIVTFRDPELWKVVLPDPDELLAGCAAVLVESRCAPFVTALCEAAVRRGLPVVVDGDTAMALDDGLLTAATHLVFSQEALHASAGLSDDGAALRRIAALTPAFVAVTTGAQVVSWVERGARRDMPAFSFVAVDSIGAGDVFNGSLTLAIAEGWEIVAAMRFAAAAAALKCSRFGGAFGAPRRSEVEAFLRTDPATL